MKPMLFNTGMVQAILDGRKTVTRRVVKPHPKAEHQYPLGYVTDSTDNKNIGCFGWGQDKYGGVIDYAKPPCRIGDIIYVRETFHQNYDGTFSYKASDTPNKGWSPSLHMPRKAARIFLRVTDVRVERLQKIDFEGACCEGVSPEFTACDADNKGEPMSSEFRNVTYKTDVAKTIRKFAKLWNSTIPQKDSQSLTWAHNPWVWVIEFERISKEDALNA